MTFILADIHWEGWIFPGIAFLAACAVGWLYFQGDKRWAKSVSVDKAIVTLAGEMKRIDEAAKIEAKRVETAALLEAKRIEIAAQVEAKRIEEGSKDRWKENNDLFGTVNVKIDAIITSRAAHDQQIQAQLTAISTGLGKVDGQLTILVPLIKPRA